ncbi:MAG: hypothetical protein JWO39_2558, partial [Gemmatimonadetes bacterium]|nr:hypothetical protein [Gemmatimonadota bacterium]
MNRTPIAASLDRQPDRKRLPGTVSLGQRGWTRRESREGQLRWGDASLTALLVTQALATFVAIPIAASHPAGRALLDVSHLV